MQVIVLDTRYFRSPLKKKSPKVPFGEGPYEPSSDTKATRGTDVTLHLKDDAKDFADGYRLRNIVRNRAQ